VSKAPTAYFFWPAKTPEVESILPLSGISGWGHWIATENKLKDSNENLFKNALLPLHLGTPADQCPLARHSNVDCPLSL
jgi:hypothetical protein